MNDSAAPAPGADEDGSGRTLGQRACVVEFSSEDADREAGRKFDVVQTERVIVGRRNGAPGESQGREEKQGTEHVADS